MGLLTLVWLALVSISAIIGCGSFAFRTLNTRRCGIKDYRHPRNLGGIGFVSAGTEIDDVTCQDEKETAFGLYIHIPYCRQRCRYCDFAIVPIGDPGSTKNDQDDPDNHEGRREQGFRRMNDRYISAVVAELQQIADRNTKTKCQKVPLRSIYFGGGTPSLAPIESIKSILYHACGRDNPEAPFRIAVDTEITMEMDPGTFDREHLSSLRDMGINRVSLGVQSFDDDILCAMGRTHRRADVLQAVRDIAFVFGNDLNDWENVNYSIDLISGCPGLTPAKWVETLQEATIGVETKKKIGSSSAARKERQPLLLSSLPPPKHISVYDMQIEEGTVFGKWAAEAEKVATINRNEGSTYENDDDEDEDPSRQFTVALPLDDGNVSSGLNPTETQSQQQRILRLPSEDECAFMYKYAAGYLRSKNYEHYEVSSYAAFNDSVKCKTKRDGHVGDQKEEHFNPRSKRSKHNQIYWEYDGQWHAVGLGATSFVNKKSVARPRQMNDYIEWVSDGNEYMNSTNNDVDDKHIDEDFLSDILLKRLRTIDGLDLSWLEANYGSEIVEKVLEGAKLGLDLELAERTDDHILRLKDPEG